MIEATKAPACPHVYEVEARYSKIVPKGQRGCVHELTADIDVLIEKTPDDWVARLEMEGLDDWGEGSSEAEAICDLVCGLGEFRLALSEDTAELPDHTAGILAALEGMVRRKEGVGGPNGSPVHVDCSEARSTESGDKDDSEPKILARYAKLLPKGAYCCGHELKVDLTVEIEHSAEGWGASVEIDCLFEYGWGVTEEQAINDLVSSLGDYKLWLIKHKDNLAECSARDLELIENMVV